MDHLFQHSTYCEKTLEHVFIAECLKALWKLRIYDAEVLRSEVDAAGYDLVMELRGVVRHIQLKSSHARGRAAYQKIHRKLADKPAGCVVWMLYDVDTLAIGPFLWLGGAPNSPIADLTRFPNAKHTKGNRSGVKIERPNVYKVNKGAFRLVPTIDALLVELFGEAILHTADS